MERSTQETLALFGAVGEDHDYTSLVELFTEDAIYYDPLYGSQVGRVEIAEFMATMEKAVPASGARFDDWQVAAGVNCGWARWQMVAPSSDGHDIVVIGESLYRLREGLVSGVVDYIDPVAYGKLRGAGARTPDLMGAGGAIADENAVEGEAGDALVEHVSALTHAGRWPGRASMVDYAGGAEVGWAQWTFEGPHGEFAGWTLRQADGHHTDFFDTVQAFGLSAE